MSKFPSIEEFDSGQVTATKIEDVEDEGDLFGSTQSNFLAREQALLGDDAEFFTSSAPTQGTEAAFLGGGQGSGVCLFRRS